MSKETIRNLKIAGQIFIASTALTAASFGALKTYSSNNDGEEPKIGSRIVAGYSVNSYVNVNDAISGQNPQTIQYPYEQSLHPQYYYSNEFEVVSAGYLCNGKQETVGSIEDEETIISMGGIPIWYGVITQNGEIIYFRAEDTRIYIMKKESENTKKLVRN